MRGLSSSPATVGRAELSADTRLGSGRAWWLFSPAADLAAFGGSAAASFVALGIGAAWGLLDSGTPEWAWIPAILLVDVAHVHATAFRAYFDRQEFARRWPLYLGVPAAGYVVGLAIYSESPLLFWRVLAYLAVFHFVRQQYGWVALYRARLGEPRGWGQALDTAAVYLATCYPLVVWHARLPREFQWFLPGDFVPLPTWSAAALAPFYWGVMAAYAGRALHGWATGRPNPGRDLVVATTAVCWYAGIVAFDSDYAFTVTNVLIHGIPYLVLVYWYMRSRPAWGGSRPWNAARAATVLLATAWLLAYVEELAWDRTIWHERPWLFGGSGARWSGKGWIVPLLAVPQLTHYVLDGVIWRRRGNPLLNDMFGQWTRVD